MNLITTTELRTKTKSLVEALLSGEEIGVVHRSKIIGTFNPITVNQPKVVNSDKLSKKIQALNLPRLTLKELDRRYRVVMMEKHGKGLSRR